MPNPTIDTMVIYCKKPECGGAAAEDTQQTHNDEVGGVVVATKRPFACPCGALRYELVETDRYFSAGVMSQKPDPA